MKTKNKIPLNQMTETPIIGKLSTPENNGIINPAFLSTPTSEEQVPDYRSNHFGQNWTNNHNNGIETQASSWVFNFNHMDSPESMSLPTHRRFEEYPENSFQHISYPIDLNKEEENESYCNCRKCCKTLLRLFIWSIIVVSLLGIAISVAFIIYIERFARCDDQPVYLLQLNSTNATNSFEDWNVTTYPLLFNTSDSYNKTSEKSVTGEHFNNSISTNVTNKLNDIFVTLMPNNTSNWTEIPDNEEENTTKVTTNTTSTYFDKSSFNSSEKSDIKENNTTVLSDNTASDKSTNESNNTLAVTYSSSTMENTMKTRTPITTPIELATNESHNNDNNTALYQIDLTTERLISSSLASSNILSYNQSENVINHSTELNHRNSTPNRLENFTIINSTLSSLTNFTNGD